LLLIHGLCMNDLQWRTRVKLQEPANPSGAGAESEAAAEVQLLDHGTALAQALGYSPIYLRYNTGMHTSQNGHELAGQLEQLLAHWPRAIEEITVLAHSMGGLVTRSALYAAQQAGLRWPRYLKNIVFLGTPHHGAPLERAGNWVDVILGSTPYSKPFAKLGQLRSAGITDLRYGHVLDADWLGHDRFRRQPDQRQVLPLPEGVACFAVAATTAAKRSALADRLLGDGLVPLNSALGQHSEPQRCLQFAKTAQWIAYRCNHMALLSNPAVTQQVLQWLTPSGGP
jgi:pimeloyl-ACP methyl ester carboxylesterase